MQYVFVDGPASEDYVSPSIHITKEDLIKYGAGDIFVETGTYIGETVDMILSFDKYKKIYTVELNQELYEKVVKKFADEKRVECLQGDSIDVLTSIVKKLKKPATFWLDAHASGELVGGKSGGSPVLDELDIIASSSIKDHTIIIDDCRLFGSSEWSYVKKEDAVNRIMKINPDYKIHYLDGHAPKDVLWATTRG